jgi:two-component system response regulator HydG
VGRPLAEVERWYTERALELANGNREEASRLLGIGERTLYRNIQAWKTQDIKAALAEHQGDVQAAARALSLDPAEVQKRLAKVGADGEK